MGRVAHDQMTGLHKALELQQFHSCEHEELRGISSYGYVAHETTLHSMRRNSFDDCFGIYIFHLKFSDILLGVV